MGFSNPHVGQDIRLWLGDSRGRWEDNTLVVDTTNFKDRGRAGWVGSERHLVERFTRVDADTITYEFTVDDPTTYGSGMLRPPTQKSLFL